MEEPGLEPGTSCMLSERSTIRATLPYEQSCAEQTLNALVPNYSSKP